MRDARARMTEHVDDPLRGRDAVGSANVDRTQDADADVGDSKEIQELRRQCT